MVAWQLEEKEKDSRNVQMMREPVEKRTEESPRWNHQWQDMNNNPAKENEETERRMKRGKCHENSEKGMYVGKYGQQCQILQKGKKQ